MLETARLRLRTWRDDDIDAMARINADPAFTRYLTPDGQPFTRTQSEEALARWRAHWDEHGFGLWAVEERATGQFLGRIGCLEPEGFPAFEIAYTLAREAWGRGFAREGAAAALRFARETLGRTAIASIIRPANVASIRVAQSLGAVAGETVEFFGAPSVLYHYPPG